jgi:hypothetical protein
LCVEGQRLVVNAATAQEVVRVFFEASNRFALPATVLSDNSANCRGSRTILKIKLAALGITFEHSKSYHSAV